MFRLCSATVATTKDIWWMNLTTAVLSPESDYGSAPATSEADSKPETPVATPNNGLGGQSSGRSGQSNGRSGQSSKRKERGNGGSWRGGRKRGRPN